MSDAVKFTVEMVKRLASERRERSQRHYAIVHAALFDGLNVRVLERDGTEHVGSPIIEPGSYKSIGLRLSDRIEWFVAGSLVEVEAVPA